MVIGIALGDRRHPITNQLVMLRTQVFERPGVAGGDCGRAPAHRVEQWIAPAFAAMERQVTIAALMQGVDLRVAPGVREYFDTGRGTGLPSRLAEGGLCSLGCAGVDLEDQRV